MKKIKITFIIPSLRGGGAENVIRHLVKNINPNKFSIKLITVNLRQSIFQNDIQDIEIINLNLKRVRFSGLAILKKLWELKPDIIFSTLGYLNIYLAILKPFFPKNSKLIARETNIVSKRIQLNRFPLIWKFLYTSLNKRFDMVVCQSQDMLLDLEKNFGFTSNLCVINNPVDKEFIFKKIVEPIYKDQNTIKLLAIGRLSHQKGFDILIDAVEKLDWKNLELNIIGDGPLKKDLIEIINKKN